MLVRIKNEPLIIVEGKFLEADAEFYSENGLPITEAITRLEVPLTGELYKNVTKLKFATIEANSYRILSALVKDRHMELICKRTS